MLYIKGTIKLVTPLKVKSYTHSKIPNFLEAQKIREKCIQSFFSALNKRFPRMYF